MTKDQQLMAEAYHKVLHEQQQEASIATALDYLASELQSGRYSTQDASDAVQDILRSLNQAVHAASHNVDQEPWQVLQHLLNKLKLD